MTDIAWRVDADRNANVGEQVWIEDGTVFKTVRYGAKTLAAGSRDAVLLGGRSCPVCAKSQPVLPGNFLFCPDCGGLTQPCVSAEDGPRCHWPSFSASGWAHSDLSIAGLEDRQDLSLPAGKWGFAVAGTPPLLLAYDHEHGLVLRYDGEDWHGIGRGAASGLVPWQRALIAAPSGFFFPTETEGLGFVAAPFVEGVRTLVSGSGTVLGGPGLYKDAAVLPVLVGGALRLVGCALDRSPAADSEAWFEWPVEATAAPAPDIRFGAPYTNNAGDLFWSAKDGYLALAPKGEGASAVFRSWRADFRALPAARPLRSRYGGVSQLGQILAADGAFDGYGFHEVTFNAARQQVKPADGPHLSYGEGTFRGDKRYDDPEEDLFVDYEPASDDEIYVPLASFGRGEAARYLVATVSGREILSDLLLEKDLPLPRRGRLRLVGRRQGDVNDLMTSIDIKSPHYMSAILYGDRLFVYANYESRIISWRIVS